MEQIYDNFSNNINTGTGARKKHGVDWVTHKLRRRSRKHTEVKQDHQICYDIRYHMFLDGLSQLV